MFPKKIINNIYETFPSNKFVAMMTIAKMFVIHN